jgi:peptidoglycan/xylan/chitin deacetylase (PgdA/CDA1 family)
LKSEKRVGSNLPTISEKPVQAMDPSPLPHSGTPYRPTVFLATCMAVGVGSLLLAATGLAPWAPALAAAAASHLALAIACFRPRSGWLGPNLTRLPASSTPQVALTFDDGPDPEVTPKVLALLAEAGARATFFLIGERARRHPELVREILRQGHRLANHTQNHRWYFATLPPAALAREIEECQQELRSFLAARGEVRYFRPPAGFQSPLLAFQLARQGLKLATWTRRGFDAVERDPDRVLKRLAKGLGAGDILLLHDGNGARTAEGRPVVLEVLPRLLELCRQRQLAVVPLPDPLV